VKIWAITMKRAAVYVPVSTGSQTTENQERELRAVVAKAGWEGDHSGLPPRLFANIEWLCTLMDSRNPFFFKPDINFEARGELSGFIYGV
jgi:hypothetical protein